MDNYPDVLKDGIITQQEIDKAFQHFFEPIESLVAKFEFGCLRHDDYRDSKIKFKDGFGINGTGYYNSETQRCEYNLNGCILWTSECSCGYGSTFGFMIRFKTQDWEQIKNAMLQETISEYDFYHNKRLSEKSEVKFISFCNFKKKSISDEDPFPTFSQYCKKYPPFSNNY